MKITKEMYERIIRICEDDYDLAHDVIVELLSGKYDRYLTIGVYEIMKIKRKILRKRSDEQEKVFMDDDEIMNIFNTRANQENFKKLEMKELLDIIHDFSLRNPEISDGYYVLIDHIMNGRTFVSISKDIGVSHARARDMSMKFSDRLRHSETGKHLIMCGYVSY